MQTFSIGSTAIDLPSFLELRVEDDTLVAYPPQTDFVNLRFTVISVTRDGQEVANAGVKLIREQAADFNAELYEDGDKVWYHVTQLASEGSYGSLMHYWYVGMGGYSLVLSCFVDASQSDHALTQQVLASVEPAILSFRRYEK